jgi:hypothetical protein
MFARIPVLAQPGVRNFTTSAMRRAATAAEAHQAERSDGLRKLRRGAQRDPELYPLYFVTVAVFGWAGWRFVQSPTGSDYSAVATVPDSEPWKDSEHASSHGKYKYHPYNDVNRPVKDAPSALNVVVVPNVNLPKSLHDQFNKWGKPEYDVYTGSNAGSGANYKQDSTTKSRNVISGDIPPGPSK